RKPTWLYLRTNTVLGDFRCGLQLATHLASDSSPGEPCSLAVVAGCRTELRTAPPNHRRALSQTGYRVCGRVALYADGRRIHLQHGFAVRCVTQYRTLFMRQFDR